MSEQSKQEQLKKLNLETAKIAWRELQRFFASGNTVFVSKDLDLIEVAYAMSQDNAELVSGWMKANTVCPVSDKTALSWYETDQLVWAVTIKPWILVQPISEK